MASLITMAESEKIIILGTGGNSIDILDVINDINTKQGKKTYDCLGFLDDDETSWNQKVSGLEVLGPLRSASEYRDAHFINGIGNPNNFWEKEEIIFQTKIPPEKFSTLIHPTASVSKMAELGRGTVIFQNVTVASGVKIGDHVVVLPNSVISHGCQIEDYTCITGGVCISGEVNIGKASYLGTNCSIIGKIKIGNFSLIGMGSVVLHDVPENCMYVGNPAKFLKYTK